MTRTVDIDMEIRCKSVKTALNRFFKKHSELSYWREQLEYMEENNKDFESDNILADGTVNKDWTWALHLDMEEDCFYVAIIERA